VAPRPGATALRPAQWAKSLREKWCGHLSLPNRFVVAEREYVTKLKVHISKLEGRRANMDESDCSLSALRGDAAARLLPKSEVDPTIDAIAGIVNAHLAGLRARCTPDLRIRGVSDGVVREVRRECPSP